MSKVIYFAQMATGPIKIGYTSNLRTRASNLSFGVPGGVEILCTIPGTPAVESWLHQKFTGLRISGEWFRPEACLLEFIEDARLNGGMVVPPALCDETPVPTKSKISNAEIVERIGFYLRRIAEPVRAGETISDQIVRVASIVGLSRTRVKDIWYGDARTIGAAEYIGVKEAFDTKIAATGAIGAAREKVTG
jgi:hypothetical protein